MSERAEEGAPVDLARSLVVYRRLLEVHRQPLNDMNVFPVADGDTGTNMLHTVNAILEAVRIASDDLGAVRVGALEGRGNSGLLLGQYLNGFSAGGDDLPASLAMAAAEARLAVRSPVEGTMLSVADAAASAVGGTTLELISSARSLAALALTRTPSQLAVLHDAGVLDSGGAGLTLFFDALWFVATGLAEGSVGQGTDGSERVSSVGSHLGYEVQFTTSGTDRARLMDLLGSLGDSVSVGGADNLVAHVHVQALGPAIVAIAGHLGAVPSTLRIEPLAEVGHR